MKKILFIIPSMSPAGGIERVVSTIVNKLSSIYDCTILTFDKREYFYNVVNTVNRETLGNEDVIDMQSRWKRIIQVFFTSVKITFQLKRYFKRHDYDYVYVTHPLTHLKLLLSGFDHEKIVLSEHGASNNYNLVYRIIKKLTYTRCHAYCVPTKTDYFLYKKLGYPVRYTPHYRPELNYQLHYNGNKNILSIGRLTADKQHMLLLNIWRDIVYEIPRGWHLNIVGDGELKDDLEGFVNLNNLNNSVSILPAVKCIADYYIDSELFVLTSRSEGFGMVLLEAISFGLPVISFDCPSGPRDIVAENAGILVPEGHYDLFKTKLLELIIDAEKRHQYSLGAFNSAANWDDSKITGNWKEVYK